MKIYPVTLPEDLAQFVDDAIDAGEWPTADKLFEYAITALRTEKILGKRPAVNPVEETVAEKPATKPIISLTPAGGVPVTDTSREAFDSPAFMAGLMDKLRVKK